MRMNALRDRWVQAGIGTAAVALVAILLAVFALHSSKPKGGAVPQTKGGLKVDAEQGEARVNQTKPLRCFVNGQYIGDFPVSDCASKNGVAAQALDVGLDPSTGQVAAGSAQLQPLPAPKPSAPPPFAVQTLAEAPPPSASGPAQCLRFVGGEWRDTGQGGSLGQCVRALFDGRCVRQGDAIYGRYGALSLRLVTGRVETSPDNRNFRPYMTQDEDCDLPAD